MFRYAALIVAVYALAASLAACGGDDGSSQTSSSSDEPTTLKVGVIPIIDVAPLYLGIQKGFFERRGLKIEPELAEGGAAIVPAVISGSNEIGFSNNVSLFIASSKGLPVKIISEGVGISPDATAGDSDVGYCEVLAPKDSSILGPADLAGKTIAVNTLNNIGDVTIKAALERNGVDPSGVKFSEIPFPDMLAALNAGRVDAAWECEPFVSQGLEEGAVGVLNNYAETDPELSVATYFASEEWLQENPEVAKRFVDALHESLDYAAAHPDEARAATKEYTKLPPEALKKLGLPEWRSELNRESLESLAALTAKYGLTDGPANLDTLVQEP